MASIEEERAELRRLTKSLDRSVDEVIESLLDAVDCLIRATDARDGDPDREDDDPGGGDINDEPQLDEGEDDRQLGWGNEGGQLRLHALTDEFEDDDADEDSDPPEEDDPGEESDTGIADLGGLQEQAGMSLDYEQSKANRDAAGKALGGLEDKLTGPVVGITGRGICTVTAIGPWLKVR